MIASLESTYGACTGSRPSTSEESGTTVTSHTVRSIWPSSPISMSRRGGCGDLLDGYSGSVVDKVLAEAADTVPDLPDGTRPGLGYRRAVALTAICEENRPRSLSTPLITVFVDDAGAETAAGTSIGPEILDRIACSASLEVIKTSDGRPLAMGRRSRIIPNRLRRFVLHRDEGCTADACTSRYRLEVHHKIPWSEGGPTDPENLTTLCWFHHQVVVHGMGFRIDPTLGTRSDPIHTPRHRPAYRRVP